ncbi:MAG: hypothetical protein AB7G12_00760 [Thermoanaerobaculia bacterium]
MAPTRQAMDVNGAEIAATSSSVATAAVAGALADSIRRKSARTRLVTLEVDGALPAGPGRDDSALALADLGIPDLPAFRFRYPPPVACYASTPFLLRHLLRQGARSVLFLKLESLVVGDLAPLLSRLRQATILLTPHLVEPLSGPGAPEREREVLLAGTYNAGVVGVSASAEAMRFLDWWCLRVEHGCLHDVARGMHFEQRWLDLVPAYFEGVEIVRDPEVNVGHWSLPERRVGIVGDRVLVDGREAAVFRFSGYDPAVPERVTRHSSRLTTGEIGEAAQLFERYRRAVAAAGPAKAAAPSDRFANGEPVPPIARRIHLELGPAAAQFGDPFSCDDASFYSWLRSAAKNHPDEHPVVTNLWLEIWKLRADLRGAFPSPLSANRIPFVRWTFSSGRSEYGLTGGLAESVARRSGVPA